MRSLGPEDVRRWIHRFLPRALAPFLGAIVLLISVDCGSDGPPDASSNENDDAGDPAPDAGASDGAAGPLIGPYCTTWTQYRPEPNEPAWSVVCMNQTSGDWEPLGTPIDAAVDCDGKGALNYGSAQVFVGPQNELYVGYEQCDGYETHALVVKKHDANAGWQNVSTFPVNADQKSGALRSLYSQYGPTYFVIGGKLHAFWSTFESAFVSRLEGASWTEQPVPECFRHLEAYVVGERGYVHCGEPKPLVWDVAGTAPASAGTIPFDPDAESSLHTSLTSFDEKLVFAFSHHPTSQQAWQDTIDTTHIAFRQGDGSWKVSTGKIQDTPGHDAAKPFLFVVDGTLHVLFQDYSTEGVPTAPNRLAFRFRVKRWSGTEWSPVGGESARLSLSQRFEYTLDDKTVLVSAINGSADHVVVAWRDGQFRQAGNVVHHFADPSKLSVMRPGAIVRWAR